MLAEDRCKKILDILDSMGSVTVQQLMDELDTSESTIRRDLVAMDKKGYLTKVHGVRLPIIRISILRMRRLSTGLSRIAAKRNRLPDMRHHLLWIMILFI